ncbi:MAG: succinylglutamate desuccinylase/aspartoacylase family protein, partial [Bacteroidota bacterium]
MSSETTSSEIQSSEPTIAAPFELHGIEVAPGEMAEIVLPINRLPTHTQIDLPAYVFHGKAPGPVLLLTASIHGDEVNGTETLRRMIWEDLLRPDAGTVIAMPIVNVYGFLHKSRALPDGKDMNRSFPGSKTGSLARRLAHTLIDKVVQYADYGVDLHTGGAARTNYPQVRCNFEREEAVKMGKAFGAPFLLHSGEIRGSFRKAAVELGKTMIVYEGG